MLVYPVERYSHPILIYSGKKGVLAEGYAALMKKIWIERSSVVRPIQLKRHLESFAPQFVGTRQQDAQEVLA